MILIKLEPATIAISASPLRIACIPKYTQFDEEEQAVSTNILGPIIFT
jgi:hypothetical protein